MAMRKTESGHGSGCGRGDDFSEKKESQTYPCTPFFLVAFRHCNDLSHNKDINRPSGKTKNIRPFFPLLLLFFHCNSLHFCTIGPRNNLAISIFIIPSLSRLEPRKTNKRIHLHGKIRTRTTSHTSYSKGWRIYLNSRI